MNITQRFGDGVHYTFQLNNQTYNGYVKLTKDKSKSGNRFFVLVDPNKANRQRIKNFVPEWFKLDAPPEGWKKYPTTRELQDILWENYKKRTSEGFVEENVIEDKVKQNQTIKNENFTKEHNNPGKRIDIYDYFFKIFLLFLIGIFLSVLYFLHHKKKTRYLEEHGVWTIMTISRKKATDSPPHNYVNYVFQLNNQTYTGSVFLPKKEVKSGENRFFMMVVPNEDLKLKVYEAIPEWFKLDAPPAGWEKHPTERELREIMNKENRIKS